MSLRIAKYNPAMKLIVLFTASFTWAFQQQQAGPSKYQYRNPMTAELLLCDQCPPGTAVKQHCTPDTPTECQPCPDRHYAESWHWGDTCQYCTSVCKERQLVKQQCNSTHDQLCECAPGFHLVVEFCIKHAVCAPGYGVGELGTAETDTVCERCPAGHFSSERSSTEPCVPHRNCTHLGLKTLRQGTYTTDSLCVQPEKSSIVLECSKRYAHCPTDVTLCEEALFHSLISLQLSSVPLERLAETRQGQRVDHKGLQRLKKACPPQVRLWMELKKDQDKLYNIMRGVNHCARVSRCAVLKNVTLDDLLKVGDSLPGVKVRPEDVQAVVSSCLPRQYVLQLLHLWKMENYGVDLAKGLTQSLRVLRSQGAPRSLLKTLKKIKVFVNMPHDPSCFKTHKPLNE